MWLTGGDSRIGRMERMVVVTVAIDEVRRSQRIVFVMM